jgi:hypothetical protein
MSLVLVTAHSTVSCSARDPGHPQAGIAYEDTLAVADVTDGDAAILQVNDAIAMTGGRSWRKT